VTYRTSTSLARFECPVRCRCSELALTCFDGTSTPLDSFLGWGQQELMLNRLGSLKLDYKNVTDITGASDATIS
jgi:hypothetical protein